MLVLGIESATAQVGVAVGDGEGVWASAHSSRDRRHAENLTPQVNFVIEQAGCSLADVEAVAVDIGPGLFTGLRVGIASAMAFAYALRVPMVGVTSLELGAFAAMPSTKLIVPCWDGRRGEVFAATYRPNGDGIEQLSEPAVWTPEAFAEHLAQSGDDVLLVGDGALRYRESFDNLAQVEIAGRELSYPNARSLVEIAQPRAANGQGVAPSEITPLYLRLPDAKINWKTRDGR